MTTILWELADKPFLPAEHDMQKKGDSYVKGSVFIRKSALRKRLTQMDPAWSLTPPEILATTGDVILVRGGLTLGGVTRYDVGTGILQTTKWNDDKKAHEPLPAFELARNLAKAYKTAVADLTPRCAINFNIGAYLKDAKDIRNPAELKAWLEKLTTPPHWALNGQGEIFRQVMYKLGVPGTSVMQKLEDKPLSRLSDTSLDFPAALLKLIDIAGQPVKPVSPANPPTG